MNLYLILIDDWSIFDVLINIGLKMTETKDKLLQIGAKYVHLKGFNNTGLQEVLKEASVPKGSFYFYFKSKEEFGLEIIDVFMTFFEKSIGYSLSDKSLSGLQRIKAFLITTSGILSENNFSGGCPIGNLSLEMGDLNESFRIKLSAAFSKMEKKIFECLRDAQSAQEIGRSIDIKLTAAFIINSWEGAIVRAKAEKSNKPLEVLEEMLFEKLLIN